MLRWWNQYRDSFIVVLMKTAVLLGGSNHLYDPLKQQLVYSPRAFNYRVCLRLVCFAWCVVNYNQFMLSIVNAVGDKSFLSKLSIAYLYINMGVVVSSISSVWTSRRKGTRPINELLEIRVVDSISSDELACIQKHTWVLFFLKSALVVLIASTSILTMSTQCQANVASIALIASFLVTQVGHMGYYYQFSLAMLYGGYLCKVLNLRLAQVVRELNRSLYLSRRKSRRLRKELARIGAWHTKLLQLMIAIKDIDQLHILVILMSAFFCQVSAMYYLLLALRGMLGVVDISTLFYSTGFTLISGIDLWMGLHICGECVIACDAAGHVLKGLTTFLVVDNSLGRDIDMLSFQIAREKMHLSIFGMFEVDVNSGPGLLKAIMMNIILLAQLSYNEVH